MNIKELIKEMTIEEKASLCSGLNFWNTKPIERLNIPSIMMTDGPHGLRKQSESADHLGLNGSIESTCFPTASALACSWNRDLANNLGVALGQECQAEDVSIILGPGVNIKRSPLCGRNFEYYSEDGFLSGQMAASEIKGIGESGVYCYAKHFALNDQETNRSSVATWSNEQAIREIYLKPFEYAVKAGGTSAMMSSFNRIGTIWAGANKDLLQTVLRDEWGFRGMVITDYDGEEFMDPDMAIRSGNDLMLSTLGDMPKNTSNTGKQAMRNASHNILYTVANSSAMGANTGSSLPVWIIVLIIVDAAVIGGIVLSYTVFNKKKKEEAVVENK